MANRWLVSARSWPSLGAAAVVALFVAAASSAFTYSLLNQTRQPRVALLFWPWNGTAMATQADTLLQAGKKADPDAIENLARRSLDHQAVNPAAARSLGLAYALKGRKQAALGAFSYSEAMSRRDVQTQLGLIEAAVQDGDISRALVHYDRALRTSVAVRDTLFPVLIAAAADPQIARPLARRLGARPLWWKPFVARMVAQGAGPEALYAVGAAVALNPRDPAERPLLEDVMRQLANSGRVDLAVRLLPAAMRPRVGTLNNGGFEHDPLLLPFDWMLAQDPDLGGAMGSATGRQDRSLLLTATNGKFGELARQLVMLTAGRRYRLSLEYGALPETGGLTISLACPDGRSITMLELPSGSGRPTTDFAVPASCPGQWVVVRSEARFDTGTGTYPWLDNLTITPALQR